MKEDDVNEVIDKVLKHLGSNELKYLSEINRHMQVENINFDCTTLIKLMLNEQLIDTVAGRHVISPNGTNILHSGGWLQHNVKKIQESEIAKRKIKIDLRNAKYALPLSVISLIVALGSLIYTVFSKR